MSGKDSSCADENYFCHIVIPSKNFEESRTFFEKAFGWIVQGAPEAGVMDVLPPSGKGIGAELNSEEEVIVPAIHTCDIEVKLELIELYGGKILRGKSPVGADAQHGFYALFEDPHGNRMALYQEP
ncbi:MAG: hypothetical protein NWE75_02125 [Candidatus Bathyarchaeota archaeon]|nr:hypothetical protein [Candidatus Bathyarchaeota archaeon]